MTRKTVYKKKDFYIALALTVIFVTLFLVSFYQLELAGDSDLQQRERYGVVGTGKVDYSALPQPTRSPGQGLFVNDYEVMQVVSLVGMLFSSILTVIGIYMCVERFLGAKKWPGWNTDGGARGLFTGLCIAVVLGFYIEFMKFMCYSIAYYADYVSLRTWFGSLEEAGHYAKVFWGILFCWLLAFILGIRHMWRINFYAKSCRKGWVSLASLLLLLAVLIAVSHAGLSYVYDEFLEEKKKERYYDQRGEDALPYEVYIH